MEGNNPRHSGPAFAAFGPNFQLLLGLFGPKPTRYVSADLSRDALGLITLNTPKLVLNRCASWL
jgi:hypothetical protein